MVTDKTSKKKMIDYYISRCNSALEKGDSESAKMFYAHSRKTLIELLKETQSTEIKRERILEFNEKISFYTQSKGIQSPAKTYVLNLQKKFKSSPFEELKASEKRAKELGIYQENEPLILTSKDEIKTINPTEIYTNKKNNCFQRFPNEIGILEEKFLTPIFGLIDLAKFSKKLISRYNSSKKEKIIILKPTINFPIDRKYKTPETYWRFA